MDREKSREWLESDLLALRDGQVEEAIDLEYKRCASLQKTDEKKREVGKDVSAFANSNGGIIVYGMKEQERGGPPEDLDEGFDPQEISKEWLENVIHGNVHPRINGLHINPVNLGGERDGKCAYVVTIPKGTTAHQAKDWRYYKRFNFQSVPMEDFEVRDVMNRYSHPLLEPIFKGRLLQQGGSDQDVWLLNITLQNQGPRRARDIKLIFYWPQEIRTTITDRYRKRIVEGEITVPNKVSVNVEHTIQSTDWIIFPEDQMRLTEDGVYRFTYFVDGEALNFVVQQTPELVWKVFADDMPPREGKVSFSHNLVDI